MTYFASETPKTLPPLRVAMDALMHRHGGIPVLIAAVAALFRAAMLRRELSAMPDHIRRDIGLPPRSDPPRLWEHLR